MNIFQFIQFYNICNEKKELMEFSNHWYQIELLKEKRPCIVVKKSAQVGITQVFLVKMLFNCIDKKNLTFIYSMPTDSDVTQFSQARFNPILQNSYIQNIDIDNVGIKRIGQSTIYYRGSFSEKQAITVPCDCNIHDEVDFSKPDIIDIFEKRLGASKYKWRWLFSTPTLSEYGIDKYYQQSTQTFWQVKCQHCNKEQELNYFDNVKGDIENAKFVCCNCGQEIDRRQGRWVDKYPDRDIKGYHITKLIVPFVSARDLRVAEYNAQKSSRLKNFYNFDLGETYSSGIDVMNREIILRQIRNEDMEKVGENCYMGVDQGDELHIVVSRREGNFRKIIYIEKAVSFDRVGQLMDVFGVRICCIDALPNKHNAKKLRDDFKGRVYLVYYRDSDEYIKEAKEEYSISVDRTEALDRALNSYIVGETILCNLAGLQEEFILQMCNMKKDIEENRYGEKKEKWVKVGDDHWRHSCSYNYIAFSMFGIVEPLTKEDIKKLPKSQIGITLKPDVKEDSFFTRPSERKYNKWRW